MERPHRKGNGWAFYDFYTICLNDFTLKLWNSEAIWLFYGIKYHVPSKREIGFFDDTAWREMGQALPQPSSPGLAHLHFHGINKVSQIMSFSYANFERGRKIKWQNQFPIPPLDNTWSIWEAAKHSSAGMYRRETNLVRAWNCGT